MVAQVAEAIERRMARPVPGVGEDRVESIIDRYNGERRWLVNILFDVQTEFGYLPREALEHISRRMEIPLIDIYGIATFYKAFSLKPRGKHLVTCCLGTACHVRGSIGVLAELERCLCIGSGCTTLDQEFTLETVNCLGSCALGPVVVIDGEYHGQMTPARVGNLLDGVRKKG